MRQNTLTKNERLNSRTKIQELFAKGSSFYLYPFLIKYTFDSLEGPLPQILVSVPKKKFKRAVDRNFLKRRIKEAYRLNKSILLDGVDVKGMKIAFIYTSKDLMDFHSIEKRGILVLRNLVKECSDEKIKEK